MTRLVPLVAAAAVLAAPACRARDADRLSTDAAAESYVRLALALGERDGDSFDSYHGPESWRAAARAQHRPIDAIAADATDLARQIESRSSGAPGGARDDADRRAFLVRQLKAIAARVEVLRGARPSFHDETLRLFDLDVAISRDGATAAVRSDIDRLLPGGGPLDARYAAFDRRFLVPPDRLERLLTRAIAACRERTAEHAPLPAGERVEVQLAADLPWSAVTRYLGGFASRITVNAALPLTVDRALDLACHEAYPGHHAIDVLLDSRFGSTRTEFLVRLPFSPQSMLHEAAASVASSIAFSEASRAAFERDVLFPIAGLGGADAERYVRVSRLVDRLYPDELRIAAQYLDGQLDFPRAAAALQRDALMPSADATLKFLNQFRSYAATYTAGRDAFAAQVGGDWRRYLQAVTDPSQRIPTGRLARE